MKFNHSKDKNIFYIVTPSYNVSDFIDETIFSVISQSGDFFIQYHVQDGGSTDGTVAKLEKWQRRITAGIERIFCLGVDFTWSSGPDMGMYDAINKGFDRLSPPPEGIMAWINADDIYMQYAFSTASKSFNDVQEMEWFGSSIAALRPEGVLAKSDYVQPYPREIIKSYCCDDCHWRVIQQNGLFWKGSLWKKAGPLDVTMRYAGDFSLWTRFAHCAPLYHLPIVLGTFRIRKGQLSSSPAYAEEVEKICPMEQRSEALRSFMDNQAGLPLAPSLYIESTQNIVRWRKTPTVPVGYYKMPWWKRKLRQWLPTKLIILLRAFLHHLVNIFK